MAKIMKIKNMKFLCKNLKILKKFPIMILVRSQITIHDITKPKKLLIYKHFKLKLRLSSSTATIRI